MNRLLLVAVSVLILEATVASQALADFRNDRPDSHAPIGVMGEHTHEKGETMLSYRYMYMNMEGNRSGSNRVSDAEVLEQFMVSPTEMTMEMHMLGAMFAPSNSLTLMTMVPYIDTSMEHRTRNGGSFETSSSGLGDIKFTGLINALKSDRHQLIINSGVSLPSGEIDERDDIPVAKDAKLPYPMQLGSGTVDLLPGITYVGQSDAMSWGAQGIGTIRLGRNDNDYSLGDRFESSVWGAVPLCNWISASLRSTWSIWGDVDGADADLNPMMVPTADPTRRGGRRADIGVGLNFYVPEGPLKSLRFATEFLVPVYQNLDGPQLETDWSILFGTQMTF